MQRMRDQVASVEAFLGSILRGAAKILGCSSANLIIFDNKTKELRIRVGAIAARHARLGEIEAVLGSAFQRTVLSMKDVEDTLVYAAWRDRTVLETDSFEVLVGTAFPRSVVVEIAKELSDHLFICVPVVGRCSALGVIIFTKEDLHPFGRQHRELFVRYAQRIGEIIENESFGRGAMVPFRESVLTTDSREIGQSSPHSIEIHLLHFALGDAAPAILVDPKFSITSCNEATRQLLGYTSEELIGRPIGTIFKHSANINSILDQQFLALSNGYFEEAQQIKHKNGSLLSGRVEALLLADEENCMVGFLVLLRDQSFAEGEDAFENNTTRLMRQERLATMGEMTAQLAHEIRNPIVSVGATLEMMCHEEDRDPEDKHILAELAREVTRVDTILQDYLSLSVRQNTSVSRVELDAVIADAIRLLSSSRDTKGTTITSTVEAGIVVIADYLGLRQVFINLLRNALEASPPESEITCVADSEEHEAIIHIDDSGPGLPDEAYDCFKPFYTTKKNGTGLGLTVCQKIIEAHGGAITLRKRESRGCRASVSFVRRMII